MGDYATVAQVRAYTNVQTSEFADAAITSMIGYATERIDKLTGRTWQGTATRTDLYIDGNNSDTIFLPDVDIGTLSAIAIDDDLNGSYTTVSTTHVLVYADIGMLVLNEEVYPGIAVSVFTKGRKTVKLTYTYGNATVPDQIEHLCVLMVANMMKMDPDRSLQIKELIVENRRSNIKVLPDAVDNKDRRWWGWEHNERQ